MIAAIAMTVLPVAPSFAAQPFAKGNYSKREDVAVLKVTQLDQVKVERPKLYKKIAAAQAAGKRMHVSAADARYLLAMSKKNLDDVKGGGIALAGILAAVLVIIPIIYELWTAKKWPESGGIACWLFRIGCPKGDVRVASTPSGKK